MQKISDSTSTATPAGEFTHGSSAGGIPATLITAEWLNTIQRELLAVLAEAGLKSAPEDNAQLLKAIGALMSWSRLSGKPTSFPPAAHTHAWSTVSGKPDTLEGYGITDAFTRAGGTFTGPIYPKSSEGPIAQGATKDGYGFEIRGAANAAAFMAFHRPNTYAAYLGLDTDNKFKVGGWSMGAVAHELFHAGNFDPSAKFDKAGGSVSGRVWIAADAGATPTYSANQLELSDNRSGNPVSLSFHRAGLTAALLTHRSDGLEVLASGGASLAPLAALLSGSNIVRGIVSATYLDTAVRGVSQGATDQDPNLAVTPVILSIHANTPDPNYYWHITTTFFAGIGATSNRGQIAVQYTPLGDSTVRVFARSSYAGNWSRWTRCDFGGAPRNTASLASPGWWRCADTGLIRQWGQTGTIGTDGGVTITLPVTFPNAMLGAQAGGMRGPDGGNGPSMLTANYSRAAFAVYNDAWAAPAIWEAWGF